MLVLLAHVGGMHSHCAIQQVMMQHLLWRCAVHQESCHFHTGQLCYGNACRTYDPDYNHPPPVMQASCYEVWTARRNMLQSFRELRVRLSGKGHSTCSLLGYPSQPLRMNQAKATPSPLGCPFQSQLRMHSIVFCIKGAAFLRYHNILMDPPPIYGHNFRCFGALIRYYHIVNNKIRNLIFRFKTWCSYFTPCW